MKAAPRSSSRRRLPALGALTLGIAVLTAGCGSVGYTESNGDKARGKELFVKNCGSCHTLADAGTTGQIGPNLDYAFYESRKNGLGESSFVQVVRGQIAYPVQNPVTGQPGMPADLVTGQDAADVAAYVASVAGRGTSPPSTGGGSATPATTTPATTTGGTSTGSSGEGSSGDAAAGKAVFTSAGCGSCHTLADAGASGTVGPNLDQAKPPATLVTDRVTNGKGAMPAFKGQLSEQQIEDVAAYISSVAGS